MSAQFTIVDLTEVVKTAKEPKSESQRAVIAAMYRSALEDAVTQHRALSVSYTPRPKNPENVEAGVSYDTGLTIRNRLEAAAKSMGIHDKVVTKKVRNQDTIVAYHLDHEAEALAQLATAEA